MTDLPDGWAETTLGELGEWRGGGTPSKLRAAYWTGGTIPWVSPKDMKRSVIDSAADNITQQAVDGSATQLMPPGSILLVTRSGILQHSLPVAINSVQVAINQDLKALTPAEGVDPAFLSAQLRCFASEILAECSKSGTTVESIEFDKLKKRSVLLAPVAEQRHIVEKLDKLMARTARAKRELDRVPALDKKLRQGIIDSCFESVESSISKHPLRELVDGQRGIPYGIVQTGEPYANGIPTVRAGDIKSFRMLKADLKRVRPDIEAKYSRTRLRGGEVLLSIRGTVGNAAVATQEFSGCNISREVALIPPLDGVMPEFVMYYLGTSEAQEYLKGHTKGVAQAGINLEDLRALPTPLPSPEIQKAIVDRIRSRLAQCANLVAEADRAHALLPRLEQALLSRAFRGELVPQDPTDEPASVLLERIKAARSQQAGTQPRTGRKPSAPKSPREKAVMTKSRQDEDVKHKPYLAAIIRQAGGTSNVEDLFKKADLPVTDFYKQLAWEVDKGHIRDQNNQTLQAA